MQSSEMGRLFANIKNISRNNTSGTLRAEAEDNDNHNKWNIRDKQMPRGNRKEHCCSKEKF